MTAVDPTRLRRQMGELMDAFNSPVEFRQQLRAIFSLYANYALRFGESAPIRPLVPMYNLLHPVMRQLNFDLQTHIKADPAAALALADELWQDEYYEIKYTAICILDALPADQPQPILERLERWLSPQLDQVLKSDLLTTGTQTLQASFPQAWEALVHTLLTHTNPAMNALGIQALISGAKRPHFENLPAVFRLASPFIRDPHPAYIRDLEDLIETLAGLSPQETGFFLRQTLSLSTSPEAPRLVKHCLSSFPEDVQADLKTILNP